MEQLDKLETAAALAAVRAVQAQMPPDIQRLATRTSIDPLGSAEVKLSANLAQFNMEENQNADKNH